uniref:Putative secreted protein n=1 Tax=Anopheles marajoara TaxID=58244 RepID=A0A2M4C8N8_9DIPT
MSSSFLARIALKYAPTLLADTLQLRAVPNSSDSLCSVAKPCFTCTDVSSSSRCFASCGYTSGGPNRGRFKGRIFILRICQTNAEYSLFPILSLLRYLIND